MKTKILLISIIAILLIIIYRLNTLKSIGADVIMECSIGTYSALQKTNIEDMRKEIQATYNFVDKKEKEFIKIND